MLVLSWTDNTHRVGRVQVDPGHVTVTLSMNIGLRTTLNVTRGDDAVHDRQVGPPISDRGHRVCRPGDGELSAFAR